MPHLILALFMLALFSIPAKADQSVRFCYNCTLNNHSRPAVQAQAPKVTKTVVYPVSDYPVGQAYGYGIITNNYYPYQSVPIPQGSRCWLQPDPYTFLGEIFGYDYIYVCQ